MRGAFGQDMVSAPNPDYDPNSGVLPGPATRSTLDAFARRALDIVVALVILLPTGPFLLLAALGIRLSSPGPALYRSQRVGQGGKRFAILKLRTMHAGGPRGSFLVAQDDERVFALGWFLRKTRIDELPQLLNVLSGQMSLVGPRPRVPEVIARFYSPEMRRSLALRPGLTSPGTLYQLTLERAPSAETGLSDEDRYGAELLPRKVAIDLAYFDRATLASDLGVIGLTARFLARRASGRPLVLPTRFTADLPDMSSRA